MLYIPDKNFDIKHVLECGQVFRYGIFNQNYYVISQNRVAFITKNTDFYEIDCFDEKFFEKYFDFSNNYDIIKTHININTFMHTCIEYGKGIRILKQQPFETLISFIISQQNNIPRIKSTIEKLCRAFGEKCEYKGFEYYAFPSVESLAQASITQLLDIGLGYRAKYVSESAKRVLNGYDLQDIYDMDIYKARKELLSFYGIGDKVCDCILLFAYGKATFPVDVWVERVYNDHFFAGEKSRKQISEYFVEMFKQYSGYAQQYLFYYKRELK